MNEGYFSKEVELRFCECDFNKKAKVSTILCHLADVAGLAYADKGYSHAWLWEQKTVFLLSRVSLHINRTPKADEILKINTWEHSTKGVQFNRLFEIFDTNNQSIIQSKTQWVLTNPHTRTILKPKEFTGIMHLHPEKDVDVLECGKFKIPLEMDYVGERKIVYSDIDANGHVYNAVYASIASDFLDNTDIHKDIADFRINFKKEALLGETMKIYRMKNEDSTFIKGIVNDSISYECEYIFSK